MAHILCFNLADFSKVFSLGGAGRMIVGVTDDNKNVL